MNTRPQSIFAFLFLATFLFASTTTAQVKQSPIYGISYNARGWDAVTDQYVNKRANKITNKYGPAVADDFRWQMQRLRNFGDWLDVKWSERVAVWSRCYYIGDVDPRRFFVTIEDSTFTLPQYPGLTIWGTIDVQARNIRVTAWDFIINRGWVVNAIDTAAWELGNGLQILKIGLPNDPNLEIGNGDPCR